MGNFGKKIRPQELSKTPNLVTLVLHTWWLKLVSPLLPKLMVRSSNLAMVESDFLSQITFSLQTYLSNLEINRGRDLFLQLQFMFIIYGTSDTNTGNLEPFQLKIRNLQ